MQILTGPDAYLVNPSEFDWHAVRRIISQTRLDGDCLIWTGMTIGRYGAATLFGNRDYVHRLMFEAVYGPLNGLYCCHHCDNPLCVNPRHLFAGTQLDNMKDMCAKGRGPVGKKNGAAKLDPVAVREIRRLANTGMQQKEIAKRFPVGKKAISKIVNRERWGHVK